MLVTATHAVQPFGDQVPEWVHLVPAGTARGADGRGPYVLRDPAAVITASMMAGRLPIDENHATDHALRNGGPAPARGWIVEMQARADGLWGRVEWTAEGRALLEQRAYRGISPVFAHKASGGEVLQLLRAALTNAPNLPQLATLHTQQETTVDLKALRAALGLADDADDAAIIAAATTARTALAAHTQVLGRVAQAAGLAADAAPDAIVTAVQTRGSAETDLSRQVIALQTQVTTMQQQQARATAEAVVDAAIRDGKPIAASRDRLIAMHMREPAETVDFIAKLPSINNGGVTKPPSAGGAADGLDDGDRKVIALMGLDPEEYRKNKAKLGLKTEAA